MGGLAPNITENDLHERFKSFGTVSSIRVASNREDTTLNRGFAHFSLQTTEAQWKRLVGAYNGSNWRGSALKIDEAKPDYTIRKEEESSLQPPTKRIRRLVRIRADQSLMTDAKVDRRPGWKRSRYGRAVAALKMRRPDGKLITIDPSHYKNNIEKLFGSVKPLPISKLTWSYAKDDDNSRIESDSDTTESEGEQLLSHSRADEGIIESTLASENFDGSALISEDVNGFSLSRLLGLQEPTIDEPIRKESAEEATEESMISVEPLTMITDVSTLLFDLGRFESLPLKDYAFCRRCGKEEAYLLWKEKRQELRADFKTRMKQAKKITQQKLTRKE